MKKAFTLMLSLLLVLSAGIPIVAGDTPSYAIKNGKIVEDVGGDIQNVAFGKPAYGSRANADAEKLTDLHKLTDGTIKTGYARHRTPVGSAYPYIKLDLGNYYSVLGFEFEVDYEARKNEISGDVDGVIVAASVEDVPVEEMDVLTTLSSDDFTDAEHQNLQVLLETAKTYRYFAIYKKSSSAFLCYEFRVFSNTDVDFGAWTAKKDGETVTAITGSGTYDISIAATAYNPEVILDKMVIVCSYDAEGNMVKLICNNALAEGKYTTGITIDDNVKKLCAFLVNSVDDLAMSADCFELTVQE